MKWSKEHFSWALKSGLMNLVCANTAKTMSMTPSQLKQAWVCTHTGCSREGWEGDRDTGEVFCPRHWLDKCLQEGAFQSGRVPGKSPVWVEALPLGLSTSERERQINFSPLWVLQPPPSEVKDSIPASKRENRAVLPALQWFMATSWGNCKALAAQADGNCTQLTVPLQSCF